MTPQQQALLAELVAANGGDAVFRPSSADRLLGCPGSIILSARMPKIEKRSTPAQQEGTAAHKVAEDALKGIRQPDEYTDRMVQIDDKGRDGWFVDEEMVEGVELYLGEVYAREEPGTERFVERRLSLSPLDPSDPLFAQNRGTGDCVVVNRKQRKLSILDLKYGKGHMVRGDSPQLKDYALMTLVSIGMEGGWDEVETVVVQPRARDEDQRIKPVSFAPMDLLDSFLGKLVSAMEEALDPHAPLRPGDHCMWCPAKAGCPALADRAMHIARDAFAKSPIIDAGVTALTVPGVLLGTIDHPKPTASTNVAVLPSPLSFDPGELSTLLDRFDLYDGFKQAVQQRAAQVIQAGVVVPGWIVEPRVGNRRFKDEPKVTEEALLKIGLKPNDIYTDPKMKSVAQIEKALPKIKQGLLAPLVERPLGEPTLKRASASKATPGLTALPATGRLGPIDGAAGE
jgi:hypothetical protein